MATKRSKGTAKTVAKSGGAIARAKAGGTARVNYRDRLEAPRVTEAAERRRVVRRAAGRVRTTAKVDSVSME